MTLTENRLVKIPLVSKKEISIIPKLSVYVHGPGQLQYIRMFLDRPDEYQGTTNLNEADVVVFTGGEDIDPKLYHEKPLIQTRFNSERDAKDRIVYDTSLSQGKFLVGICRGGQFLNVMNGGTLWQDVNNHGRSHRVVDVETKEVVPVSSTHHQMMRINVKTGLRVAATNQATRKTGFGTSWETNTIPLLTTSQILYDDEVVWYKNTRSLCFQPHPEYDGYPECTDYFFRLLDRYFDFADRGPQC